MLLCVLEWSLRDDEPAMGKGHPVGVNISLAVGVVCEVDAAMLICM